MTLYELIGAVQVGLIFGLVAVGAFLSFRVLDFPDLTVEGSFPLDEFTRERLLNGWDDIGLTLRYEDEIGAYESRRPAWLPTTA